MADKVESQREYYNTYWSGRQFENRLKLMRCNAMIKAIITVRITQPRILDLGCGTGWLAGILGHFGPTTGVELSDEAMKIAAQKYPYVEYIATDFYEWDHPKEYFDIVISQEVIEHVEEHDRYLGLVHDLLKPGGYLILTTPNPRTFYAMPDEVRVPWSQQPIENWISIQDLRKLTQNQFRVTKLTTIIPGYGTKGVYRYMNSKKLKRLLEFINGREAFESLGLFLNYGLHTLMVAQKRH